METLRDCKNSYLRFRFADEGSEILVFDRNEMNTATEEIVEENSIPDAGAAGRCCEHEQGTVPLLEVPCLPAQTGETVPKPTRYGLDRVALPVQQNCALFLRRRGPGVIELETGHAACRGMRSAEIDRRRARGVWMMMEAVRLMHSQRHCEKGGMEASISKSGYASRDCSQPVACRAVSSHTTAA